MANKLNNLIGKRGDNTTRKSGIQKMAGEVSRPVGRPAAFSEKTETRKITVRIKEETFMLLRDAITHVHKGVTQSELIDEAILYYVEASTPVDDDQVEE